MYAAIDNALLITLQSTIDGPPKPAKSQRTVATQTTITIPQENGEQTRSFVYITWPSCSRFVEVRISF